MKCKAILKRVALKRGKALQLSTKPIKRLGRPRFKKGRDPAYVAWIGTQPCILATSGVCASWAGYHPVEAAHVRSRGAGGTDRGNTVPMCMTHHAEQHRVGIRSFQKKYGIDLKAEAERLAELYEER